MSAIIEHIYNIKRQQLRAWIPLHEEFHLEPLSSNLTGEFISIFSYADKLSESNNIILIKQANTIVGYYELSEYERDRFIRFYQIETEWLDTIIDELNTENSVVLNNLVILEDYQCKGIGNAIVNLIEKSFPNKSILLYSLAESEEYWIKKGFRDCSEYVYLMENNKNKLAIAG